MKIIGSAAERNGPARCLHALYEKAAEASHSPESFTKSSGRELRENPLSDFPRRCMTISSAAPCRFRAPSRDRRASRRRFRLSHPWAPLRHSACRRDGPLRPAASLLGVRPANENVQALGRETPAVTLRPDRSPRRPYHHCNAFVHAPDPETDARTAFRISCESASSSTARAMIIAPTRLA